MAPPADPVELLWFKMAGTGVPNIVLHVSCWTALLWGILGPKIQFFSSKVAIFCCFWAKIVTRERLVKMIFFYKIRWLVKSILATEPKFHEDWCKNGHDTRKKPKKGP